MATIPTDLDLRFDVSAAAPGVNPFSARGLRGTLSPIDAARGVDKLARTVNGTLIDISAPQMRKFRLEIVGNDQAPPSLDNLWVGTILAVFCHVETAYMDFGTPSRPAVSGSERAEGSFIYYRPEMLMMVVDYQIVREEWEAAVSWTLTLEEV